MKSVLFGLGVLLLFAGCAKEKPRAGLYWAEFYTTDDKGLNVTKADSGVRIDSPTESSLSINGSLLQKNGNQITGTVAQTKAFNLTTGGLTLDGTWKQKGAYYKINGNFTAYTVTGISAGTFRMESY